MIPAPLELCLALAPALVNAPVTTPTVQAVVTEDPVAPALHVLNNADLQAALERLAKSPIVELSTIATSRGGRAVHALKVAVDPTGRAAGRPAILVAAGLEGSRAYTSSMVVDHIRRLVDGYGVDGATTSLLDTTTLYFLPRLDVDAAAARFATPLVEVHGTGHGVDNDRDGRQGEDAAADVDGDGFITSMRIVDPEGEWVVDPADPRALKKADRASGELGVYKLYGEGFDNDGDERVAEDSLLDAALNRNFSRNWEEHAADAGRYPTDEPAVLGLVEFVLDHSDIALVMTYGEQGNLVEKPTTQKDGGPSKRGSIALGLFESDAHEYAELSERYRAITDNKTKGLGEQPGSLQAWLYHHRGLWSLDIDPWSVPLDAKAEVVEEEPPAEAAEAEAAAPEEQEPEEKAPEPSDDAKRLLWLDQNGVDAFAAWTSFEHPQLGALEIGGFKPYSLVEPTPAALGGIAAAHYEHLLTLGALLPRPKLELVEMKALGGGLYEVEALLSNAALLPLQSHAASRSRTIAPLQVHLDLPSGATLIAGEPRTLVSALDGVGGRREFRWLITLPAGATGAELRLVSKNAGQTRTALEVK